MTDLTLVSLFDGIGGFPLAFSRAEVRTVATVEIDKAAAAVAHRHFPGAAQFPDVTEVTADDIRATGFVPDRGVVTFGWPCQDFSVAGRRAGLAGARSGLWWQVVRILAELRPRWIVGENVPGLLSSCCQCPGDWSCVTNGRAKRCDGEPHDVKRGGCCVGGCMETHGGAMGFVLGSLAELGYGYAYRVLDAQHFGVPQQRRRVVIVGHLGTPFGAAAQVLLEPESSAGDSPASGSARTDLATCAAGGVGAAGRDVVHAVNENQRSEITLSAHAAPLSSGGGKPGQGYPCIVQPLALRGREGGAEVEIADPGSPSHALRTPGGGSSHAMVCVTGERTHTLTSEGADASEDGTGRGTPIVVAPTAVATETVVRRLTELECERVQGYPDEYTAGQAGSPRYRQLGNSIAVPVFGWLAHRIVAVDTELIA